MGSKYTTQTISGYNSSPPSDDGTQTASNQVKWSTQKTKLTDPLKTQVAAIDTALVSALDTSVNSQSSNYTTVAGDHWKTIEVPSGSPTITMLATATGGAGYTVGISNIGTGTTTVAFSGADTINGATKSIQLKSGQYVTLKVNANADGYDVIGGNIIFDNTDPSKQLTNDISGLTTATVRTVTWPDANLTVVGTATTQTLTNKTLTSATLTAPAINGALSGDAIAAQAEMETGTATDSLICPGNLRYHPSTVKAWLRYNGSIDSVISSYNITSVTKNSTGNYTVNIATDLGDANSAVFVFGVPTSNGTNICIPYTSAGNIAAGTVTILMQPTGSGAGGSVDCAYIVMMLMGDFA